MGANTPKSILDREYRELASRYLEAIMDRHHLKKRGLAEALGVDRSVASRYLSRDVRPPLQRLQFLERTLNEALPPELAESFWASEGPPTTSGPPVDIENEIRSIGAQLSDLDKAGKAAAKRELQALLKKLG